MAAIFKHSFLVPKCKDCKCSLNIECNIGYNEQFFSKFNDSGKRKLEIFLPHVGEHHVIVAAILTCLCPNKQIDDTIFISPPQSTLVSEARLRTWIILNTIVEWSFAYGCL